MMRFVTAIVIIGGLVAASGRWQEISAKPRARSERAPSRTLMIKIKGDAGGRLAKAIIHASERLGLPLALSQANPSELSTMIGCHGSSKSCLKAMAGLISARAIIVASKERKRRVRSLVLRRYDRASGRYSKQDISLPLRRAQLDSMLLRLFGVPKAAKISLSKLFVSSSPSRAEVWIGGRRRGVTPLTIEMKPVKDVKIVVKKAGYVDWEGQATVQRGRATRLRVPMKRLATGLQVASKRSPAESRSARGSGKGPSRQDFHVDQDVGFWSSIGPLPWILAGTGIAAAGAAVFFGLSLASDQSEMDELSERLAEGDVSVVPRMDEVETIGNRNAVMATVFWGVAGTLIVASGVLALYNYLSAERGSARRAATKPDGNAVLSSFSRIAFGPGWVGFSF